MTALPHAYRILVVSAVEKFCEQLMPLFPESIAPSVDRASSINQAQRKIADRAYDIVIVSTPLPDDFGVRFAIDVSTKSSMVVMLFVHTDFYDAVYDKVYPYGVFVVRRPTSPILIRQSIDWLVATRERLRSLEKICMGNASVRHGAMQSLDQFSVFLVFRKSHLIRPCTIPMISSDISSIPLDASIPFILSGKRSSRAR